MRGGDIFKPIKSVLQRAPTVLSTMTVQDAIKKLKSESKLCESIGYVYVVDEHDHLVGVFSIKEIFRFPPKTRIEKLMIDKVVSVSPRTSLEVAAHLAIQHEISAIPVTENGKLLGAIMPRTLMQIVNSSLRKDIFHFAGINHSHPAYENTLKVPLLKSVRHRLPWLLIGLAGILCAAGIINLFENTIEQYLILAFFMPAIVYMSSALGTQIQTLFIRDIAVVGKSLNLVKYMFKQGLISTIISSIASICIGFAIALIWQKPYIGLVIAIACFITMMITSITAFSITLTLKKSGKDPALGAGPFATVVSDTTSIIIYLLIASIML